MRRLGHPLTPWLFLAPALAILGLFLFWPMLQAFYLSFTAFDGTNAPRWVGLGNYAALMKDGVFLGSLWRSALYLVGVVPPLVFIPLLLAVLVNRPLPGMKAFRAVIFLPVVVSMVVAGIMWRWLYAENGLLNYLGGLAIPHLMAHPLPWLSQPETALAAVMVVTVWKGLGYYMVVYLAGLQTLDPSLYDASAIDGATPVQQFWRITLPLMAPSLAFVAIVSAISALKVFTEIYVLTKGGPLDASTTVVYYLYQQAFENFDFGYANAIGVVLFLLVLALSLINLRFFEQGGAPQG